MKKARPCAPSPSVTVIRPSTPLENEIDELCLRLMARIKPVAGDLRFVVAALRMVVDLERIGDEAVTVAEQTVLMEDVPGGASWRTRSAA